MRATVLQRSTEFASIFLIALPLAVCAPPALPFYDWNACPFEGCTYREWQAVGPVSVYNTWKTERTLLTHLAKGDNVIGLKGVVITFKPGLIRVDRDVPEQSLHRGDTILTYAYRGEGFSAVSVKGRYYREYDISIAKWPDGQGCGNEHCAATYVDLGKKEWWAMIRLRSGKTGWVLMEGPLFTGVDMLA